MSKRPITAKQKRKIGFHVGVGTTVLLLILFLVHMSWGTIVDHTPTLTIQSPQKVFLVQNKEIVLDVTISSFADAVYPAASASISFDPAYLEFLGLEEGNVFVHNPGGNGNKKLPEWSCNPTQCNKTGKINLMYLDVTGGKNAFSQQLLAEENNVVFRLRFRLRGSARVNDVYDLVFEDAVFAASDESQSLAMSTNTLKVQNGKIIVGES